MCEGEPLPSSAGKPDKRRNVKSPQWPNSYYRSDLLSDLSDLISSPLSFVLSALASQVSSPLFRPETLLCQGLCSHLCSNVTFLVRLLFKWQHLPSCSSITIPLYLVLSPHPSPMYLICF